MKNLKILFVAIILTCAVGVIQSSAQAHIEKGSQDKYLLYEVDGVTYFAVAYVEYQWVGANNNFNWVAHGTVIETYNITTWELVEFPKKTVKASDAYNYYDEKVTINPQGKVTVSAHVKVDPWW